MKEILGSFFVALFLLNQTFAQTKNGQTQTAVPIEMRFPKGKSKALILSYDDGKIQDRQLVKLMNQYGLIGTFHLNANKLGTENYLNKEEIKLLFTGHEVSVHTFNHPNLPDLSKIDVVYEVLEDRKELERLVGYPVRGMAYPFGNTNEQVIDAIEGLGIEYGRTVEDTHQFKIPEDFFKWHPTIHQFAKAYWEPNNLEKDKQEMRFFYEVLNRFNKEKELALLEVWGHSWELANNKTKWEETEKFFSLVANKPDIHYTSHIDLLDYIHAFRNLKFSVEKNMVYNTSSIEVWFKMKDKIYSVPAGSTIKLVNE